jgi:uncharacterized protein
LLFAAICLDKPGQVELRLATRPAHLAYLEQHADCVRLGGAFLDPMSDNPIGSLLILNCPDLAAAQALLEKDPYARAGLFANVELRPWRRAVGAEI